MSCDVGFYKLSQLYSRRETERQKPYDGIFPWGKAKIQRMVRRGEFPKPIKGYGRADLWDKAEIHAFIEKMKTEGMR